MILIVDDFPDACRLLVRLFRLHAIVADYALSGPDALQRMKSEKPTLVILDVMMPGMTGIEVLETMRADRSLADVPVMMFSASTDAGHRARATELGAVSYLVKSDVQFPKLLSTVAAYASNAA